MSNGEKLTALGQEPPSDPDQWEPPPPLASRRATVARPAQSTRSVPHHLRLEKVPLSTDWYMYDSPGHILPVHVTVARPHSALARHCRTPCAVY